MISFSFSFQIPFALSDEHLVEQFVALPHYTEQTFILHAILQKKPERVVPAVK